MDYFAFRETVLAALHESRLPSSGMQDGLDLSSLDRRFQVHVQPMGGSRSEPFGVGGTVSFHWDTLLSARSATTEEDVLTQLHGHVTDLGIDTELPYVRVDIQLHAYVDLDRTVPLAGAAARASWMHEIRTRLDNIEPVIPEETVSETPDGLLEVLAWQGDPELTVVCNTDGSLRLKSVCLDAFQMVDLPRQWDDPERDHDADPSDELIAMFARLRATLHAWAEALDHLH